jgi:hypothetical protein
VDFVDRVMLVNIATHRILPLKQYLADSSLKYVKEEDNTPRTHRYDADELLGALFVWESMRFQP